MLVKSLVYASLALVALAKKCKEAVIPVRVTARTAIFGGTTLPTTDLGTTTFIQNLGQQGRNYSQVALTGYRTTSKTYQISTVFCTPDSGYSSSKSFVQVLTHGIGFDKSYWDFPGYSYVDEALSAGYSTLTYDRLGIGKSSHGNPLDEIQAPLEIEALHQLILMLKSGRFPGVRQKFGKNVVAVGHSFGSAQSTSLVNMYPDLVSGLVLTGFSVNSSFTGVFLAGGNFVQADHNAAHLKNYCPGYIVSSNIEANQFLFFTPGGFDPRVLQKAEDTKQPTTPGELLTLGAVPTMNAFSGPVFVLDGQGDLPYCGGDCLATGRPDLPSIAAGVKMAFPKVAASDFGSSVLPKVGHGINLHYGAKAGYQQITRFLRSKGLA